MNIVKALKMLFIITLITSCASKQHIKSYWSVDGNNISFCHNSNGNIVCSELPKDEFNIEVILKDKYT